MKRKIINHFGVWVEEVPKHTSDVPYYCESTGEDGSINHPDWCLKPSLYTIQGRRFCAHHARIAEENVAMKGCTQTGSGKTYEIKDEPKKHYTSNDCIPVGQLFYAHWYNRGRSLILKTTDQFINLSYPEVESCSSRIPGSFKEYEPVKAKIVVERD